MNALLASIPYWGQSLIKVVAVLSIVPVASLVFVYVYLFKMMAHMQSRLGPMEAGPHGAFQLLAEAGKFLQKEDIHPDGADKWVFIAAPFIVLMSTFLLFLVIPGGPDLVITNFDTGIFFALAVSSLSVIGVLMAGWASANKYALLGGLRAAGQLVAYELPMVLAVVGVVIQAGTMSMQGIIFKQANDKIFGLTAIGNPYILTQFVGFLIFLISAQAELTQTPFDMPVAESELVAGYMVEYTGFRFLFFFMAEFGTAFGFSAIISILFLGGWTVPFIDATNNIMNWVGPAVLFGKIMVVSFLIFWVRFSYPRLREDQLQKFAWKVLIPVALANIVVTSILKVAF